MDRRRARIATARRSALRFGEALLVLALVMAVWLLLVDTASLAELLAGGAATLLAGIATALVDAEHLARLRLQARLLLALPVQLASVPLDLWLLARELGKALTSGHRSGSFYELAFDGGTGPLDNGRRAAVELLGSLSPNTIVLGVDERAVIVHQLVARHEGRARVQEIPR
jgi:multisubunit Na+/H+ antiporter MnhE subunit